MSSKAATAVPTQTDPAIWDVCKCGHERKDHDRTAPHRCYGICQFSEEESEPCECDKYELFDEEKRVALIGPSGTRGAMTSALLASVAGGLPPMPFFSGNAPSKRQRVGPPKLSGKRLERMKKQNRGKP